MENKTENNVEKKIDLKSRFKSINYWLGNVGVIIGVPLLRFNLKLEDIVTWDIAKDVLIKTVSNPSVLFWILAGLLINFNNPTTKGLTDYKKI